MARRASESEHPSPDMRTKVLYIMGAGRSGSTILGVTLGNCSNFFYAGELDKWLPRHGRPQLDDTESVTLWRSVRNSVDGAPALFGPIARTFEQSSAVINVGGWFTRRVLRRRYHRVAANLYQAIARNVDARHVVDSSHYPRRARELRRLDSIDLYLLFLVRTPRSVMASFDRDNVFARRFGVSLAGAYVWLTYLLSVCVFRRQPSNRRLLIRYEDFVKYPERVLRDILDCVEAPAAIPDLHALRRGVPFFANGRVVGSPIITLDRRVARPPRSRILTALIEAPWTLALSTLRPVAPRKPAKARER